MEPYNIIVILGPTASGKTRLAAGIAALLDTEIISADSRQVYKGMNIGTGKDLDEYNINGKQIPYHQIDIVEAGSDYNLNDYIIDFKKKSENIISKKKVPILCGGTGLYIDAVLKGYEYAAIPVNEKLRGDSISKALVELQNVFSKLPETSYHKIADTSTFKRTIRAIEIATWLNENGNEIISSPYNLKPVVFGLACNREMRRERIAKRLQHRIENGLIEEVESLLNKGVTAEKLIFYGLEYRFVIEYLQKKFDRDHLVEHLTIAIQQFAKRQMTYFRKMEREGLHINWIDADLSLKEQMEIAKEIIGEFGYSGIGFK